MRRALPVLAAALVALAAPAAAGAAARLVSPVGGAAASTFPTLRWTLPSGEESEVVYVASKASRLPSGEFPTANLEDTGLVSGRTQRHRLGNGLYAGTHYWVVGSRDRDFEQHFSRAGRFRVVGSLSVTRVRVTSSTQARSRSVRMRLKTNARRLGYTIRVVQNGRVVQTVRRSAPVLNPGVWGTRTIRWTASSKVTKGQPATLSVTVKAGSRTFRTTLTATAP